MKSPFTGGEVRIEKKMSEAKFRGEKFSYIHHSYICVDTGENFTDTIFDNINTAQVYNQYRVKYGIPFTDEIIAIRKRYNISAKKMSEILGFGTNQYRLYEAGEIPNPSNGHLIKSCANVSTFSGLVEDSNTHLTSEEQKRLNSLHTCEPLEEMTRHSFIFRGKRSIENGYAPMRYDRLRNIILYILNTCKDVYHTKMNKFLFYVDFLSYKTMGHSMTGLSYNAKQYGPVPQNWDRVYSLIDGVTQEIVGFPSGGYGTLLKTDQTADLSDFSEEEKKVMNMVSEKFSLLKASELVELSHKEDAWIDAVNTTNLIDFNKAFSLKGL